MIVITGAAGLVGSALTRKLANQGNKIKAIVTPTDDTTSLKDLDIEIIVGDVRDFEFLCQTFKNARIVYHLAGIISITSGEKKLIESVNVGGTENVIEACLDSNVGRLVYMSSVHALAELPQGQLIDETAQISPNKVIGDYANSKAKATLAVFDGITRGLDAVIVYSSGIIGPDSYSFSNMGQLFIDYIEGRIPILIDGTYDFVDVRDVVTGTISAAKKGITGDSFILSGYQITIKQLFAILSNLTGRKKPKLLLPNWLLKWFIPLATFIAKRSKKKPTLTSYALYSLSSNSLFSHEKATEQLDFQPRHIARTIKDTINWYKKIGRL